MTKCGRHNMDDKISGWQYMNDKNMNDKITYMTIKQKS